MTYYEYIVLVAMELNRTYKYINDIVSEISIIEKTCLEKTCEHEHYICRNMHTLYS